MGKLCESKIPGYKPGPKDIWKGDGGGLWLRIRVSGYKTFVLRRKRGGKATVETLGEWPYLKLAGARREAESRKYIEVNPESQSVADAVKKFLERRIEPSYRRPEQIQGYLIRDLAPIASRQLINVRKDELAEIIAKKVAAGPVAANRLLESIKRFFGYCAEMGWLENSPAAALTRNIAGGKETARERILTDNEIRQLWTIPAPHGPLLQFLLLTGARIGETQKATRSEIDGELWRIPAEHTKNARAHLVHLSPQARAALDALPRRENLLFGITSTTAVQSFIKRWCERQGIEPRWTAHDLRRTANTRMNEIGIAPHIVEKCLNHTLQGVAAIYNRAEYLDERREAFNALGREVELVLSST